MERLKVVANGREIEIEGNKEFLEKIKEGGNFYVVAADYVDICAGCEEDYTRDREDDVTVVDETTKNGNIYLIVGGSVAVYGDAVEDDEDDGEDRESVEDQDDEDSEEWSEENRARSSSFKKKLLVACGVIAVLVVAAVLIINVFLPNKARETFDHYIETYVEEGAGAISNKELADFAEAYRGIDICHNKISTQRFWHRYRKFKVAVLIEKIMGGVSRKDRLYNAASYFVDDTDLKAKQKYVFELYKETLGGKTFEEH